MNVPTNRPDRMVRLGTLGQIHNLLEQVETASNHEERGKALDKAVRVFKRMYRKAKNAKD